MADTATFRDTSTWARPRRYDYVTGCMDADEARAAGFMIRPGDAVQPGVLVMDEPGRRTAFVAVDLHLCQVVEPFSGEVIREGAGCAKCGARNLPIIGHEPCPGPL